MRLVGRAVAIVLGLWLAALLFAGIGVGPLANIPLAQILRPSAAPPALPISLKPKQPTAVDLKPARAAAQTKLAAGAVAPAQTLGKPPLATAQPRRVRPRTTPGKATPVPGPSPTRTSHASPTGQAHGGGKEKTTTTTTTTPGRSRAAPGHSRLPGSTSGH
jgi:hypothetical protein